MTFVEIWNDPILGNVIASIIVAFLGTLALVYRKAWNALVSEIPNVWFILVCSLLFIILTGFVLYLGSSKFWGFALLLTLFLWFIDLMLWKKNLLAEKEQKKNLEAEQKEIQKKLDEEKKKIDYLNNHLGIKIKLKKLEEDFSNIQKIAIIGLTKVGKTTLINHLCRIENRNLETFGEGDAYIYNFSNTTTKLAALLDTFGQDDTNQIELATKADKLIILLDHNISDVEKTIDQDRLQRHSGLITKLLKELATKGEKPQWIHVIMNKRDLWSKNKASVKEELESFFQKEVIRVKSIYPETTSCLHENPITDSITLMLKRINKHLE